MTRFVATLVAALTLLVLLGASAFAHKPSDSYLTLSILDQRIEGRWDIALRDLEHAIGLDANQDGALTWGEIKARHGEIAAYALARLDVEAGRRSCTLRPKDQLVETHSDGAYTVLLFDGDCRGDIRSLDIGYRLFFDVDPLHRGLLRIEHQGRTTTAIFAPDRPKMNWTRGESGGFSQFFDYFREGVWHIWIGFDHVLFLVTLLLPSVLRRKGGKWQAVPAPRDAALPVVKVVTAFTAAHSITLSVAALGLIELPSRLVEAAIAASVVVVAVNNIRPLVTERLWAVAFGFGLVHGFGFASVLGDLGLQSGVLLRSLLGFNLGVEAGQLAIVAVVLPLIFAVRSVRLYPKVAMPVGSTAIALVAGVWLIERAFG